LLKLVLSENGTPRTLASYLIDRHTVTEAGARRWQELENGDLLSLAEAAGFGVLVTTDKKLRYQQNLQSRHIAIIVLGAGRWSLMRPYVAEEVAAVDAAHAGSYAEVDIPFPPKRPFTQL
jgi:hypothetical protein